MTGFRQLSDEGSRGFHITKHDLQPMRGRGFKKFAQKALKSGKKFVKALPAHVEKYNQIKGQIENAYDQYQDVKENLPDFVKDNRYVKTATSQIESTADRGRALRDKTDSIAEAATKLSGGGLKLAGRGRASGGRADRVGRADPVAGLREKLMEQGRRSVPDGRGGTPFNRGSMLTYTMDLCDLDNANRKMCKDYCKLHPEMSIGEVSVLPFATVGAVNKGNRKVAKKIQKQIGSGKKLNSSIKSIADIAKILTPLIALL